VPGVSENIKVRSIVDKFLEHSRIAYFGNGDEPEVFLSSADWMPRNFRRRVELMFPIDSPPLRREVDELLALQLADNVKARELQADGTYKRVEPRKGAPAIRSQVEFQRLAVEHASSIPMTPAAPPELDAPERRIRE
jgi:polyphosphate kinase